MILLAPRFLPETVRAKGRFDFAGAVTATLGVGAIVFGIIHAAEAGWANIITPVTAGAGLLVLVLFVLIESRAEQPIMPLRLLTSRIRVGGSVGRLLYLAGMMGFFFFTTQFLQEVLGFTPLEAGLGFLPMTIVNFAVAMAIPAIVRRFGQKLPLVLGVALTLVGMFWLSRLTADTDYLLGVALPMAVIGIGQGLTFAPLTSAGIADVRDEDAGAASGLVNTFHQVGSSVGLAILVAISAPALSNGGGTPTGTTGEVATALTGASIMLALSLVTVIALILPATRNRSTP